MSFSVSQFLALIGISIGPFVVVGGVLQYRLLRSRMSSLQTIIAVLVSLLVTLMLAYAFTLVSMMLGVLVDRLGYVGALVLPALVATTCVPLAVAGFSRARPSRAA